MKSSYFLSILFLKEYQKWIRKYLEKRSQEYHYYDVKIVIPDDWRVDVNIKCFEISLKIVEKEFEVKPSTMFFVVHGMTIKPYIQFLNNYLDMLRSQKLGLALPNYEMTILCNGNQIRSYRCARATKICAEHNVKCIKEIVNTFGKDIWIHLLGLRINVLKKLVQYEEIKYVKSIDSLAGNYASKGFLRFNLDYRVEDYIKQGKKLIGNYMITGGSFWIKMIYQEVWKNTIYEILDERSKNLKTRK